MTMARPTRFTDLPEATKKFSRDAYVGNECDTDQYRETQPEAGLGVVAELVKILSHNTEGKAYELDETLINGESRRVILKKVLELSARWVDAAIGRYEGTSELQPILAIYHDVLWARDQHPYYGEGSAGVNELIDTYEEELDREGNLKTKES